MLGVGRNIDHIARADRSIGAVEQHLAPALDDEDLMLIIVRMTGCMPALVHSKTPHREMRRAVLTPEHHRHPDARGALHLHCFFFNMINIANQHRFDSAPSRQKSYHLSVSQTADIRVEALSIGPFANNCYVLHKPGHQDCLIVDASAPPAAIIHRVRELGLEPTQILLTHAHIDHILGLPALRSAFPSARVALHPIEHEWLAEPALNLSGAMGEPFTADPADDALEDGQTLEFAGESVRVLHTPGHSPGSVTFVIDSIKAAIVGDTLFANSIGRYDFPTSDGPTLMASIRDRLYALPDSTRVLPGHGPETTIGREKRTNPFVRA